MQISGHGRAHELASLLLGVQETERPSQSKAKTSDSQQDQVDISEHAKEMARIKALALKSDPERGERVQQIRQAVDGGTYNVSGRTAADALIRHALTEAAL
ncbi:MAG TPA: flagellar biosynthesis anti-sigma factor FlgM [Nitrospiraceae bacterium]|nr:flagellar biosynthesis anti-sigma factor FlgM [Nitrospiraceae bacterium]